MCRSTLASEASAADEGSDRSAFINMMLSEFLYAEPAHKAGCRLDNLKGTDSKSLYEGLPAVNITLTDKRSFVNTSDTRNAGSEANEMDSDGFDACRWVDEIESHSAVQIAHVAQESDLATHGWNDYEVTISCNVMVSRLDLPRFHQCRLIQRILEL